MDQRVGRDWVVSSFDRLKGAPTGALFYALLSTTSALLSTTRG